MICNDQKGATFVAASILSLGLIFAAGAVSAAELPATQASAEPAAPAAVASAAPLNVVFVQDDFENAVVSTAKTVRDFLVERGLDVADDDYVSVPLDQSLAEGLRIVYRPAVPVVIEAGAKRLSLRSSAATIAELLATAHVDVANGDDVSPALESRPLAHEIVRVSHVAAWNGKLFQPIVQGLRRRFDSSLPKGTKKTIVAGHPGQRVVVVRYVRRDDGVPSRTVVATHVVRPAQASVVAVGTGVPPSPNFAARAASFASVAQQGLASAVRIAGNAIHMIATAYTAGCYGCSGITASGQRAGWGIVAVDPHVIPLGTKLFIPGYGHAVAGDTGGAINGNRIDLGMDTIGQALRFGRRDITVYVIR